MIYEIFLFVVVFFVSEMTYYVSSGTLNSTNSTQLKCFRIMQFISDVAVTHFRQQLRIALENILSEKSFV